MAGRVRAIDDEIRVCMSQLQGMGVEPENALSSVYSDSTKSRFPLQGMDNPVPGNHIKAQGKRRIADESTEPYIAKDKAEIKRGDLSLDGIHHYWANYFCDPSLCQPKPSWADDEDTNNINFNSIDNGVNRISHHGSYALLPYIFDNSSSNFRFGKFPINPVGKTGISGRGQLGKWGPNHAADSVMITKRGNDTYVVLIKRGDTGEWALPGGMVELGDNVCITLKKEFGEEAMNTLGMTVKEKKAANDQLEPIFKKAKLVFNGYVDDPRNTDNAWMETVVMLIEVTPSIASTFKLKEGDDAVGVQWKKYTRGRMNLYASHDALLKKAMQFSTM